MPLAGLPSAGLDGDRLVDRLDRGGLLERGAVLVAGRGPHEARAEEDEHGAHAGHEADPDYASARALAKALAWADLYLLSALRSDDVEELSMIPIERVGEVRRLIQTSTSCLVVSQAELTSVQILDES